MQYSLFRSVFLKATVPVVLASLVWQAQELPTRGNALPVSRSTVAQPKVSSAQGWNSVLHVARLVESRQRSTNLVLQLEVLNKPQTTYANAVYQVFARTRGDREWQEIHTNRGARLMPGNGGKYVLESEVISIAELEREIRDELGEDLRIEDVELDCVVSIRYDLAGGGRDLREKITYRQSYSEISTTSTTAIVRSSTSSTVTASSTSSTETAVSGQTSNRQAILTSGGHDDDDDDDDGSWEGDDDDDDDDDDDGGNRNHRGRRRSSNSRTEVSGNRSSRRRSEIQSQVTRAWDSVLHVARQTGSSQQNRNLVLQLEILNKPQTTYANVVYQVFARTRGGRWQEIYTNSGARLIESAGGKYILKSEVISLTQLEQELRDELGDELRLEDVEINCVSSIRYDLAGGGRDIRETFSYQRSYTSIVSTTVTEITQIVGSSTTIIDNRSDDHGDCRRCSGGGDDDDDDGGDDDDDDGGDDDDDDD
ncbi:hypothetical protein [Leptothoe spongobia]|uniref:Uncharacterized protein n=1 Tax=Leptothoe spongobia TAU-MAC 1115 TaxID=1967444 RepID=A0A947GG30_9CYAN|nr:hypothetical protein [Leptothoe spongobia]MBT9313918.1 hypothetical protein [Leptothoe spongobia TAU-MAC 1115]